MQAIAEDRAAASAREGEGHHRKACRPAAILPNECSDVLISWFEAGILHAGNG